MIEIDNVRYSQREKSQNDYLALNGGDSDDNEDTNKRRRVDGNDAISTTTTIPTSSVESPKERKKRSWIWNHFEKISSTELKCKYCEHKSIYKNGTTSNFIRHLEGDHQIKETTVTNKHLLKLANILFENSIDWIIASQQPFSFYLWRYFM